MLAPITTPAGTPEAPDDAVRVEERARLRRELHDGLGPLLTAISMRAATARHLAAGSDDAVNVLLESIQADALAAIGELRSLLDGLHPAVLHEHGLVTALRPHLGPDVSLETTDRLESLPPAVELAAYRIVCEAVHNARRHATATGITVTLTRDDDRLTLIVADNGHGILPPASTGLGMNTMRQRAEELGGTLALTALPGTGVTVRADLPLRPRVF